MTGGVQAERVPAALNLRYWEIAGAAVLTAASAIMAWQAVLVDPGWGPGGPQAGFFPFWVASIMLVGSVASLLQAVRSARPRPVLEPGAIQEVLKVGLPMAAAVALLPYLGFYVMSAVYVGAFGRWYGRHSWWLALGVALVLAVGMFFAFEKGFKLPMPKSALYGDVIPF